MTKKEKEERLATLDENVLGLLIKNTSEDGDTTLLTELSVAVNYLKSNAVVSEKTKASVEDDTAKRLERAKKRRENGETPE